MVEGATYMAQQRMLALQSEQYRRLLDQGHTGLAPQTMVLSY